MCGIRHPHIVSFIAWSMGQESARLICGGIIHFGSCFSNRVEHSTLWMNRVLTPRLYAAQMTSNPPRYMHNTTFTKGPNRLLVEIPTSHNISRTRCRRPSRVGITFLCPNYTKNIRDAHPSSTYTEQARNTQMAKHAEKLAVLSASAHSVNNFPSGTNGDKYDAGWIPYLPIGTYFKLHADNTALDNNVNSRRRGLAPKTNLGRETLIHEKRTPC